MATSPSFRFMDAMLATREKEILHDIVANLKPAVAVEIGSWIGGSARIIAPHAGRLFCVDPWSNFYVSDTGELSPEQMFLLFCLNTQDYLFNRIIPCRGESATFAKIWTIPIDFLFIDGDHSHEGVKIDINGWMRHMKGDGVVLGHDYDLPGVAKAVDESFKEVRLIPDTTFWIFPGGS